MASPTVSLVFGVPMAPQIGWGAEGDVAAPHSIGAKLWLVLVSLRLYSNGLLKMITES